MAVPVEIENKAEGDDSPPPSPPHEINASTNGKDKTDLMLMIILFYITAESRKEIYLNLLKGYR